MNHISTEGLDLFATSLSTNMGPVNLTFGSQRIAVLKDNRVTVHEVAPIFTCEFEKFDDCNGIEMLGVDFYCPGLPSAVVDRLADNAVAQQVEVTYYPDSGQLWVMGYDLECVMQVLVSPEFPKDLRPNYDPEGTTPQRAGISRWFSVKSWPHDGLFESIPSGSLDSPYGIEYNEETGVLRVDGPADWFEFFVQNPYWPTDAEEIEDPE